MNFIGRNDDLSFLQRCYEKDSAQLVVIYGRRRIGKTELLRQFCANKPHVWHSCTRDTDALQLRAFSQRLMSHLPTIAPFMDSLPSWQAAFESIAQLDIDGRKLVIIDEFPYAAAAYPALASILQNVWDEVLSRSNVMLVLCGSSVSFMEDELLGEENPLFGRATGIWKMQPLSFAEACEFFPSYTVQEQLEAYGMLGGIPHYLEQFDSSLSLKRNACENILARGCVLSTECDFLLRQELREPATYNAVITAIAAGATELNEVAQKSLLDGRTANSYLTKLRSLGVVNKSFSVGTGQQEQSKSTRGLWSVSDNFFRFWYGAARPLTSELDAGSAELVWEQFIVPNLNHVLAPAFEDICRQWVQRRNAAGELPFVYQAMGRWWQGADEIDLVATGPRNAHLLGECKFRNAPTTPSVLRDLSQKEERYFPKGRGWLWLFSKTGYDNSRTWDLSDRIRLVEPEELRD